jgi:non-specific serine/threonine protein kinase
LRALAALVDQSLVFRLERDGEPRYTMLETIREFGLERLKAHGEECGARDRHGAYFLDLVASLQTWAAPHLPETVQIYNRLETEYPNLRAAMAWQIGRRDVSGLLALAGGLSTIWQSRGHFHDSRDWLEWGLAQDVDVADAVRAGAHLALARILYVETDFVTALAHCEVSLRYYRACGDASRIARACELAGSISLNIRGPETTEEFVDEALATLATLDDVPWVRRAASQVLLIRAVVAKNQGDLERAERELQAVIAEQRTIARESGKDHPPACWPLLALGAVSHAKGDLFTALECYQASLEHAWRFHDARCTAYNLSRAAGILAAAGRWQDAARLFGATEAFCEKSGFAFSGDIWHLTRAFGLPQPWGGAEDYVGQAAGIRAAVLRRAPNALPPLPDPDAAAELWAAGKNVPIEHAVTQTIAVDLAKHSASLLVATITGVASARATTGFTPRQQEILALLCQRYTDPEIASKLFISPRTVEGHVARIFAKLGVDNRRDAAAVAARLGLV